MYEGKNKLRVRVANKSCDNPASFPHVEGKATSRVVPLYISGYPQRESEAGPLDLDLNGERSVRKPRMRMPEVSCPRSSLQSSDGEIPRASLEQYSISE